jgi:hypothetical protein
MSKYNKYLDSAAQTVELAMRTSSSDEKSHLLDLADRSRQQATRPLKENPLVKRAFRGLP